MRAGPVLATLVVALGALPGRAEDAPDAGAPQAEQVAADVKAGEEALIRLREQATSVLDELANAEEEVHALEEAAAQAEAEARAVQARVAVAQKEEQGAREALVAQLDLLAPRLRARYELGRQRRSNLLLSASSLGELLFRKWALDRVLEGDLALLARAREGMRQVEARRARLEAVKAEHSQRIAVANEKRQRARRRKEELGALHDSLVEQQDLKEKTLKELYRVQADLSRYVSELRQEARAAEAKVAQAAEAKGEEPPAPVHSGFRKRKGKLPYPAKGIIEVPFGKVLNPKFNTVTFQKGVDLRAPDGSPVAVIAPGKVVHAGPFRGYGNLAIVDHGDGCHSLYAHLGALQKAVGDEVAEGDVLGTVGDTGSLKGAYLYFEIREKGKPVDPAVWLAAP